MYFQYEFPENSSTLNAALDIQRECILIRAQEDAARVIASLYNSIYAVNLRQRYSHFMVLVLLRYRYKSHHVSDDQLDKFIDLCISSLLLCHSFLMLCHTFFPFSISTKLFTPRLLRSGFSAIFVLSAFGTCRFLGIFLWYYEKQLGPTHPFLYV